MDRTLPNSRSAVHDDASIAFATLDRVDRRPRRIPPWLSKGDSLVRAIRRFGSFAGLTPA